METSNPLVILTIFDSVGAGLLYNFININQMPYLKKYVFDRAAIAENCFTSFPTNTIPGHLAILTGKYADKHHLATMRFWNLSKKRYRDYSGIEIFKLLQDEFNPEVKMIYEYFSENEAFTSSNFAKGAKYVYLNRPRMIFYYLMQKLTYKIVLVQSLKTFLRHLQKKPTGTLYVIWLPVTDLLSHTYGPSSIQFQNHLKEIDQLFFRVLFEGSGKWKGLNQLGLNESTYFFLTADHGSFDISEKSVLIHHLNSGPIRVLNKRVSPNKLENYNFLIGYTDGFASLYVKNPISKHWNDKAEFDHLLAYPSSTGPIDLIQFILNIPSVSHVFVKKQDSYLIFSSEGQSQIQRKIDNGTIMLCYKILSGKDPLLYEENSDLIPFLDGNFHPFHEWFGPLSKTNYPMILDQIPRLFDCKTMGDILFMGKEGHSFDLKNEKGTHDTGTKICAHVPLIMAGPKIKHMTIPNARTVDIVPTILYLLNKKADFKEFDGRILREIIE